MLFFYCFLINSVTYTVKGTTLFIDGTDPVTQDEVLKYVDIQSITKIIINDGIPEVSGYAFYNFALLTSVSIPKSCLVFEPTATRWCGRLEELILDPANPNYELVNGILYNKGKTILVRVPSQHTSITIPRTCKKVLTHAFNTCRRISSLFYPNSITELDPGQIYDTSISRIVFETGSKYEEILGSTFSWTSLSYIFLPKSVKYINPNAFYETRSLSTIVFEEGSELLEIRDGAFTICAIANLTIPPNVTKLGSYVFNTDFWIKTIHIPASVTQIDPNFLSSCNSITKITIDAANSKYTCQQPATLLTKDGTTIFYISSTTTSFQVPANIKSFGVTMLQSCSELTSLSVQPGSTTYSTEGGILYNSDKTIAIACAGGIISTTLSSQCTKINDWAFYGLEKLQTLKLNNVLVIVNNNAFRSTKKLIRLDFPATLNSIGNAAFRDAAIQVVTFQGQGPTSIGNECFRESQLTTINFGSKLTSLGQYAFWAAHVTNLKMDINCSITRLETYVFARCDLTTFTVPLHVKFIDGLALPWNYRLTELKFPTGCEIQSIGINAFQSCPIKTLTIPKTVTFLGNTIWADDISLTSLIFEPGSQLTKFGSGDFRACNSLVRVTIPASITYFDASVFLGCANLLEINVETSNKNYKSLNGVVYTYDGVRLVACPGGVVSSTIANYIKIIGANAFYRCQKLSKLTFADGCKLEEIEEGTFFSCTELTRVDLPTSLRTVMRNAFAGCTKLAVITFPDNALCDLQADSIFADCVALTTFTFGKNCALTTFGPKTFSGCISLEIITIPANCHTIGNECFLNCKKLATIRYDAGSKLQTIGDNAFAGCTSLVTYNVPDVFNTITAMVFGSAPSITTVSIAANKAIDYIATGAFSTFPLQTINFGTGTTVNTIQDSAFINKPITSFTLNCPLVISSNAFKGCTSLSSIQINGVTSIGDSAFSGCTALQTISIPSVCTSLGSSGFENCNKLSSISFARSSRLTSIGSNCFAGCVLLTSFTVPDSFTSLTSSIFGNAPNINTVIIPSNMHLSSIGTNAFSSIPLTTITLESGVVVDSLEDSSFSGKSITSFVLNCPMTIKNNVFENCASLSTIQINGVKSIGNNAFHGCSSLTAFTVAASCTSIGANCFDNCNKLATITFQSSSHLQSIGQNAFVGCISLKSFTIPDSFDKITSSIFGDAPSITAVNVPANMRIKNIGSNAFSSFPLQSINFGSGTTVDVLDDSAFADKPLKQFVMNSPLKISSNAFKGCNKLEHVEIESASSIGDSSFSGCTSLPLVKIPSTCTSIGSSAFRSCTSLNNVSIQQNSNLNIIGDSAFSGCSLLCDFFVPKSVTSIGANAYQDCVGIENVTFSRQSNLRSIGMNAFSGCTSLTNFTTPDSFTEITSDIFGSAPSIHTVRIPSNVHISFIATGAFRGIRLKSIIFEEGVTVDQVQDSAFINQPIEEFDIDSPIIIGDNSFMNCANLFSVKLANCKVIGSSSFKQCTSLTTISISRICSSIGDSSFALCTSLSTIDFASDSSLSAIGDSAFAGCTSIASFTVPKNVISIGSETFSSCANLSSISFVSGCKLMSIGDGAFRGCSSLLKFTTPDSFTTISKQTFGSAPSITDVTIPQNMHIDRICSHSFESFPLKTIIFGSGTTVDSFEDNAFSSKPLESITVHIISLTGKFAFSGCTKLKTVTLRSASAVSSRVVKSSSDQNIPEGFFDGCLGLEAFITNFEFSEISDFAFRNCNKLTYTIPNFVLSIGRSSFENCFNVVDVPPNIVFVGNMSFFGSGIQSELILPTSISFIGSSAFMHTSVRRVYYCGSNDMSTMDAAFEKNTKIRVTYKYPASRFCTFPVYRYPSCNEIHSTMRHDNDEKMRNVYMIPIAYELLF